MYVIAKHISLFAFILVVAPSCIPPEPLGPVDWDVRGNYELTYDNSLTLKLNIGGAVREATADGWGEIVDFGTHEGEPLVLDLAEYCEKPEVKCADDILWSKVAIDQQEVQHALDGHFLRVIDATDPDLPEGVQASSRGGLVDHRQRGAFLIGLDGGAEASEHCAVLALSLASGRFAREGEDWITETVFRDAAGQPCEPIEDEAEAEETPPVCEPVERTRLHWTPGAAVSGIVDGRIGVAWAGGCAFGPILVGATLTIETGFSAVRTGPFDPPSAVATPENEDTWEDLVEVIEEDLDEEEGGN